MLRTEDQDIKKEILWCFENAVMGGSVKQIDYLIERCDFVDTLSTMLETSDARHAQVAMKTLETLLEKGSQAQVEHGSEAKPYLEIVSNTPTLVARVVELQDHDSADVSEIAKKIVGKHFGRCP